MSEVMDATAPAGGEPQSTPGGMPDFRASLEAAYDEVQSGEEKPAGIGHNNPPEETPPEAPAAEERLRGPDGKFVAKPGDPNAPAATPPAAQPDKLAPPEWLKAHAQVDWNRLPKAVQEALAATPQSAPPSAPPSPLTEVVRPYEAAFQQRGVPVEAGIRGILDMWLALEHDHERVLPQIARRYGMMVVPQGTQTAPAPTPQTQQEGSQPAPSTADPQVQALHQQLQEIKGHLTAQQQAQFQAQIARVASEIDSFAKDTKTPRPHFEAVQTEMAVLIQSGAAKDLADAYDKACWANPTVRTALLEEQRRAEEAKRTEDAAKRAAEAKRAVTVNVRSSEGTTPKQPSSIRESLEAAYDAMQAAHS